MHKIDAAGATGTNTFTEGNPGTGTPATQVGAKWLNAVQAEIVAVIEDAGITLDDEDDAQLLEAIDAIVAAAIAGAAGGSFESALLHVRDEKVAGTDGGDFTSGAWRTRTLNTVKVNQISGASLSSNVVSLPAGRYRGFCRAPGHEVGLHQARLRDTTNNVTLAVGGGHRNNNGNNVSVDSMVNFDFTLAGTVNIELQHRCGTTDGGQGFGMAVNFDEVEVYAEAMIWKVS